MTGEERKKRRMLGRQQGKRSEDVGKERREVRGEEFVSQQASDQ